MVSSTSEDDLICTREGGGEGEGGGGGEGTVGAYGHQGSMYFLNRKACVTGFFEYFVMS